jgi:hypothetical protein
MNTISMMKRVVLGAALATGVAGIAQADDYSSDPAPSAWSRTHPNGVSVQDLQGDSSWQWQMRGQTQMDSHAAASRDIAAWRAQNPNGLTQQQLQSFSSWAPEWQPPAQQVGSPLASATVTPSWHQDHPHGLSEVQLQALSSEAPAWHGRASSAFGPSSG